MRLAGCLTGKNVTDIADGIHLRLDATVKSDCDFLPKSKRHCRLNSISAERSKLPTDDADCEYQDIDDTMRNSACMIYDPTSSPYH